MAAPVIVQQKATDDGVSTDTLSVTLDAPVSAGNMLVAVVQKSSGGARGYRVTDDRGNAWATAMYGDHSSERRAAIYYAPNASSGTTQVTVTLPSAAGSMSLAVFEVSGADAVRPLAAAATWAHDDTQTTHPVAPPAGVEVPPESLVMLAGATNGSNSTLTPPSGYTTVYSGLTNAGRFPVMVHATEVALHEHRPAWGTSTARGAGSVVVAFTTTAGTLAPEYGPPPHVLMVSSNAGPSNSDDLRWRDLIVRDGLRLTIVDDDAPEVDVGAEDVDVVLLGNTVDTDSLGTKYVDANAGVLTLKRHTWPVFGLTTEPGTALAEVTAGTVVDTNESAGADGALTGTPRGAITMYDVACWANYVPDAVRASGSVPLVRPSAADSATWASECYAFAVLAGGARTGTLGSAPHRRVALTSESASDAVQHHTAAMDGLALGILRWLAEGPEPQEEEATPEGVALTLATGTATAAVATSREATPEGVALTMSSGTATAAVATSREATPEGVALTLATGTATAQVTQSREAATEGVALTLGTGTATVTTRADREATTEGVGLTLGTGAAAAAVVQSRTATPAGEGLTLALGSPTTGVRADRWVEVLGTALTASAGDVAAEVATSREAAPEGVGLSLGTGTAAAEVVQDASPEPEGVALDLSAGTPGVTTTAGATVAPSGAALTLSSGTAAAHGAQSREALPDGLALTLTAGDATTATQERTDAVVIGAPLTLSLGEAQALVAQSAVAVVVGQAMSLTTGAAHTSAAGPVVTGTIAARRMSGPPVTGRRQSGPSTTHA